MPSALDGPNADRLIDGRDPPKQEEDCSDCGPPPELTDAGAPVPAEEETEPMSFGQLLGSIGILCLSIPAIVGACCWPMVVAAVMNVSAAFMNGGAGAGVVDFFHGFQVAIMMTVMFNLTQFTFWRCKQSRRGNCWQKYEPVLHVLISSILVNVQPIMILALGSWHLMCCPNEIFGFNATTGSPTGRSYQPWGNGEPRPCTGDGSVFWDDKYCTGSYLPTFPTKTEGWLIQVFCTWGGFVFMFIGIMQATQMHRKFIAKWRAIRAGRR